jgi:hypothetical protein
VFPALLAGEVQIYFGPLVSSIEYIRAGKLRGPVRDVVGILRGVISGNMIISY